MPSGGGGALPLNAALTAAFTYATVNSVPNTPVINLTWTNPDFTSIIGTYDLWRSTSTGTEALYITGVSSGSYQDTAVSVATTYFYRLMSGTTQASNEASKKTACSPPSNLVLTPGDGQISGTFTGSTSASGYNVYVSIHNANSYTVSNSNIQITSFVAANLTDGTQYDIYVTALD